MQDLLHMERICDCQNKVIVLLIPAGEHQCMEGIHLAHRQQRLSVTNSYGGREEQEFDCSACRLRAAGGGSRPRWQGGCSSWQA